MAGGSGVFDSSIMLVSEHKRILSDAQKRGDERARDMKRVGYWQGVSAIISVLPLVALFAGLVGLNYGLWWG
jgi:hypothetical protein